MSYNPFAQQTNSEKVPLNPFNEVETEYVPPTHAAVSHDEVVPSVPQAVPAAAPAFQPTQAATSMPAPSAWSAPQQPMQYGVASVPAVPSAWSQPNQGLAFTETTANAYNVSGKMGAYPTAPGAYPVMPGMQQTAYVMPGAYPGYPGAMYPGYPGMAAGPSAAVPPIGPAPPPPTEDHTKYPFYNIRKYRPYFDISTKDVLWRVTSSLFGPFKPDFIATTQQSPDLYGPFWIATTLVFVVAVAGNYSSFLAHWSKSSTPSTSPPGASSSAMMQEQWYTDYTKLSASAGLFYGYVFVLGLIFYFAMRYIKAEIQLINIWCIYGYAMTVFIPVCFVCVLPFAWLQWTVVMCATVLSGMFLVANFKTAIYAAAPARAIMILAAIALLHVGLGLGLKLYFFAY